MTVAVVGLDLAPKATGVVSSNRAETIKSKLDGAERLYDIWCRLEDHIGWVKAPRRAVLEDYAWGSHLSGVRSMAELGGVVRLYLVAAGIPFALVNPTHLKQFACGKAKASKDEVFRMALKHNPKLMDNNAADAWWLYQMGLANWAPQQVCATIKIGKVRRAVLEKVQWPG